MSDFPFHDIKVLLVEDNPHFRDLVRSLLEVLGVQEIEEAGDGAEALEMLKTFPAHLAILDWKMAGVDGVECVRRIRREGMVSNRFLPVIMLTGYTEERLIRDAREAGVNGVLGKPISSKSLFSRILTVLNGTQVYVETTDYFGPDRRVGSHEYKDEERRLAQTNILTYEPFHG